jgi:hypothetical protein
VQGVDEQNTALTAALGYVQRGWHVLPCFEPVGRACACGDPSCGSAGKHPRVAGGLHAASTDADIIGAWWRRWPGSNVAIRTGTVSGLVVVDIDYRHGGDETLRSLARGKAAMPPTQVVRTGDGFHLYFSSPPMAVPNDSGVRLGPGIDVRGDGGYVIAPPSRHVSGGHYRVIAHGGVVAPLPSWLVALVAPPTSPPRARPAPPLLAHALDAWARAAVDGETSRVRMAPAGARNVALNRAAFSLGQIVAGGGLDRTVVEQTLLASALESGLGEREARATIASGLRAGAERPRQAPAPEAPATDPGERRAGDARRRPPASPAVATVRFVPWPADGPLSFPVASRYVERCWTSVIGPTAVLLLRSVVDHLPPGRDAADIDLANLARALGLGEATAKGSVVQRTLARLEQFHLAEARPDGTIAIRTALPALKPHQLRRAGPLVERWHQELGGPPPPPGCSLTR